MNGEEDDTFTKQSNSFLTWLTQEAKLTISPKIALRDLRDLNQGRAIVAIEQIDQNEILFEIPRSAILNTETSQLSRDFPAVKKSLETGLGHWEGLIVCLFYEWQVLGSRSRWWPYLQVLPSSSESLNTLMYWSDEELSLLKPSLVLDRIGRDSAREMFGRVVEFVKKHELESTFGDKLNWEVFLHIASVVMSYSFDVEQSTEENGNARKDSGNSEEDDDDDDDDDDNNNSYLKSMVPFADTLNADTKKCNANLVYGPSSLTMQAIKPIANGEQIYNTYGEYPNSEILRRYGYVEWDGSLYDFGEVLLDNIKESLRETLRVSAERIDTCLEILKQDDKILKLLNGTEIVTDAYDCYVSGEILVEMVVLLQIMCAMFQIPDQDNFKESILKRHLERVAKKCIQLIETGSVTQKCVDIWKLCIDKRLSMYSSKKIDTSSEGEDAKFKAKGESLRESMASTVLNGEVNALKCCRDSLEKQYKIVEDDKLLSNVLKRKLAETESERSAYDDDDNHHRSSRKKGRR